MIDKTIQTRAPAAVFLIRLMVSGVFLSEEIQKFLFPSALGVGLKQGRKNSALRRLT